MEKIIPVVAAVDIGGTKTATAIGTVEGMMLARFEGPTQTNPDSGIQWIEEKLKAWLHDHNAEYKLQALTVGCPGPLDRSRGMILRAPNLKSWNEYPLRNQLSSRLQVDVDMENDANLAAVGEHRYGAGIGCQDLIYVTVSTGIGAGLIVHSQLVRGVDDSAGEIGHMTIDPHGPLCNCGNRGCLEAMASGTAIMQAAERSIRTGMASASMNRIFEQQHSVTAREIAALANTGDSIASSILNEAMVNLGVGISNLITTMSPQVIVLGGGVARIGNMMFETVKNVVKDRVKMVPVEKIAIVPAKLGGDSALYGGFYIAASRWQIASEE